MNCRRKSWSARLERLEDRCLLATLPAGFAEQVFATGLDSPTALAFAPDGRLFVTEQAGTIEVIKNGQKLATPFLNIAVDSAGERGLLGIAFDPQFASNQYVYVYYTTPTNTHNRVSRFTAMGDVADPASERIILELDPLSAATNHNGGAIHFAPDGTLFVATGENANPPLSQSLSSRLGKILRINPDGTIPADNPFAGSTTGANASIWAIGLRNPFTFAINEQNGVMFINDVGQGAFEEVNRGRAGANYGWPSAEGPSTDPRFDPPVFSYPHGTGNDAGRAVIGAAFYTPENETFPADYRGDYFFAEFANRWIRRLDPATGEVQLFATNVTGLPTDLAVGDDGGLYYLTRNPGQVTRVSYAAPAATEFVGFADGADLALAGPLTSGATSSDLLLVNRNPQGVEAALLGIDPITGSQLFRNFPATGSTPPALTDRDFLANLANDSRSELVRLTRPTSSGATPSGVFLQVVDPITGQVLSTRRYEDTVGETTYAAALAGMVDPEDVALVGSFTRPRQDPAARPEMLFFNKTDERGAAIVIIDLIDGSVRLRSPHAAGGFAGWLESSDEAIVTDTNNDGFDDLVLVNRVPNPEAFRSTNIGFVGIVSFDAADGGITDGLVGFSQFFAWNYAAPGESNVFPGYDDQADRVVAGLVTNDGASRPVILLVNSRDDGNPQSAAYAVLQPRTVVQGVPDSFQLISTIGINSVPVDSFDTDDLFLMADVTGDGSAEVISYSRQSGSNVLRTFDAFTGQVLGQVPTVATATDTRRVRSHAVDAFFEEEAWML